MAMKYSIRQGKFKHRFEIDWNEQDPLLAGRWCWENFGQPTKTWFRRGIRNAELDYTWYFYFVNEKEANAFALKWA